jgi:hypothetical protein
VLTVELEHLPGGRFSVAGDENAQRPRLFVSAASHHLPRRFLEFGETRERDDETAERTGVAPVAVGAVIDDRGAHVLGGGRKEARVVDDAFHEGLDGGHVSGP